MKITGTKNHLKDHRRRTIRRYRCTGRCGICNLAFSRKSLGKFHGQRRSHEEKDINNFVYESFGIIIKSR